MNRDFFNKLFSCTDLVNVLLLFGLGSIVGSFYYCIAMCVIEEENWKKGRSHGDVCGHLLKLGDLIPVVSFLFLKGRCRHYGWKPSYQHLTAGLLLGIVYVLIYYRFQRIDLSILCLLNLLGLFLGLSLIDLESYIIPDVFIVAGIINRFIDSIFWLDLRYSLCRASEALFLAGVVYFLSSIMNKISKKENLGGGDIKLIFMIGLYTGFYYGVWVLLGSSLIGLIYTFCTKKRRIPFGPFLSVSAVFVLLYQGLI